MERFDILFPDPRLRFPVRPSVMQQFDDFRADWIVAGWEEAERVLSRGGRSGCVFVLQLYVLGA